MSNDGSCKWGIIHDPNEIVIIGETTVRRRTATGTESEKEKSETVRTIV